MLAAPETIAVRYTSDRLPVWGIRRQLGSAPTGGPMVGTVVGIESCFAGARALCGPHLHQELVK
jgi:hypothetical protein